MSKIIVRIKGGLGNQLFCYAAARRLALVNDAELIIDDVTGFIRDRQYRRIYALDKFAISARKATSIERMEPFERYRRGVAKLFAQKTPFQNRKYIQQEGIDLDSRLLEVKPNGTVYIDGLWQSEMYFKDVERIIKDDLRIISPVDSVNREIARKITSCNSVCIHVRWFDKPKTVINVTSHNLESNYYKRAIQHILDKVSAPHFFIFSDDPISAKKLLALPENMVTCVSHNVGDENAYADLWLMKQCHHIITANSTFSWWGAWLGESDSKIIITPGKIFSGTSTAWGFSGLIPDRWCLL
ncbi:alpha-1,2-fucosyltransferase [Geomonas edaphica]|uniref:alpha-1,2-fucosyltransferase n=1 Tax=Geomonas edaphica TaxID=2570226 RepID=UPI0010A7BB68|nr:alpha-1,2-fucosyltransferase [Geomonas edaphica]